MTTPQDLELIAAKIIGTMLSADDVAEHLRKPNSAGDLGTVRHYWLDLAKSFILSFKADGVGRSEYKPHYMNSYVKVLWERCGMNIYNINSPRYQRMDGPVTEELGKVNYYMDRQTWCTFMCTEKSGTMVLKLEKHDTLQAAMDRLVAMHQEQTEPPYDDVTQDLVAAKMFAGLEIEDEV